MKQQWALRKATCLSEAWHQQFGVWPTLHAVLFGLAQATAETIAGDAWPGPDGILGTADDVHNWGACNLRALNAAELAVLARAGIKPSVGADHEARAAAAMAAIRAAGLLIPNGEIHCDSSPQLGAYFVYFAKFRDWDYTNPEGVIEHISGDVGGARYYLRIACGQPGKLKALYNAMCNPSGTLEQHCRIAYAQHYYTGTSNDPGTNIQRYMRFMGGPLAALKPLLASFDPAACEAIPLPYRAMLQHGDSGEDVREAQEHMGGFLVAARGSPDGDWGNKTDAGCLAFRAAQGLSAVAVWDDACRAVFNGAPPDPMMERLGNVQFGDWKPDVEAGQQADELARDLGDT